MPIYGLMIRDVVIQFGRADLPIPVLSGFEILHVVEFDPQQTIHSILAR